MLASSRSKSARVLETVRQSAVIGLRAIAGTPLWLIFGFSWWIQRAWRDLLEDAAWREEILPVDPAPFNGALKSGEAKP
jgi:hypothetical protein